MKPQEYGYWIGFRRPRPGDIPPGWQLRRLQDLATFSAGGRLGLTMSDYCESGFDAYSAEGLNGKAAIAEFDGPAVIVSSIGARCGKCFLARGKFTTLANVQVIFPDPKRLDPGFLWNLVNDERFWPRYATAQPFIRPSDIKESWIPVPPPDEQAAIARILDAVDTALEHTRAAVERARELRRALMQELLPPWIGLRELSAEQMHRNVTEIVRADAVTDVSNGSTPSRGESRYWRQGNVPWLATGKVHDRVISAADEFVTEAALRECSIRLLPPGTVLVGMIGQGRTRGMSAYLAIEACINQNFGAFTPKTSAKLKVWGQWLFYYLDFHYSRLRELGGGTNQGALSCYLLKRVRFPLVDLSMQKKTAAILDAAEKVENCHAAVLASLARLKKSLMHDLLTGRVRVRDASKVAAS